MSARELDGESSRLTCLLQDILAAADLLCQVLAVAELLHQPSTDIVLAVPFDLLGGVAIEDQADWELCK